MILKFWKTGATEKAYRLILKRLLYCLLSREKFLREAYTFIVFTVRYLEVNLDNILTNKFLATKLLIRSLKIPAGTGDKSIGITVKCEEYVKHFTFNFTSSFVRNNVRGILVAKTV